MKEAKQLKKTKEFKLPHYDPPNNRKQSPLRSIIQPLTTLRDSDSHSNTSHLPNAQGLPLVSLGDGTIYTNYEDMDAAGTPQSQLYEQHANQSDNCSNNTCKQVGSKNPATGSTYRDRKRGSNDKGIHIEKIRDVLQADYFKALVDPAIGEEYEYSGAYDGSGYDYERTEHKGKGV